MAKSRLGRFKCKRCNRTFSMAAHLARHNNTVHAAKGRKKTAKKRIGRRRTVRGAPGRARRARPAARTGQTPLLQQMHAYRGELVAEHAQVASQIEAIDRALAALGAAPGRAPARRGPRRRGSHRSGSLKSYVERVLGSHGVPMAVKDVTSAVRKAGFKSKNKTLAKSVGIAMAQMPNVAKVSRGMFRLK
jgi:hypothetical protein